MKILLLAFLLTLGAVLFFAYFAFAPDTLSWENKIQNELVAERADIKKDWENADQWGEEMGSNVCLALKKNSIS